MLPKEREFRILKLIEETGFVTISTLVDTLNVSRSSINRDLIKLEEAHKIKRERGGATLPKISNFLSVTQEESVSSKEKVNTEEKDIIAKLAATRISDGDCIYIDSGSTMIYLLEYIKDKNIEIITPSNAFIKSVPTDFKGTIYTLGGKYSQKYDMGLGPLVLDPLSKFNFSHAFISANGIDLEEDGVYSLSLEAAAIKECAIRQSRQSILLIDHSKFQQKGTVKFSALSDFNEVIVDKYPDNLFQHKNFNTQ